VTAPLRVLFVSVVDSNQSPISAGWLNHLAGNNLQVRFAADRPSHDLPAIIVMAEVGIDITTAKPSTLDYMLLQDSDVIITLGPEQYDLVFPGKRHQHWVVDSTVGRDLDAVRALRDTLQTRVRSLLAEL
jgi:arsenate reductase